MANSSAIRGVCADNAGARQSSRPTATIRNPKCRRCSFLSPGLIVFRQQNPAYCRERNASLPDELIVKSLQAETRAFGSPVVFPQFVDLKFAERVIEVRGIVGAAPGFLIS